MRQALQAIMIGVVFVPATALAFDGEFFWEVIQWDTRAQNDIIAGDNEDLEDSGWTVEEATASSSAQFTDPDTGLNSEGEASSQADVFAEGREISVNSIHHFHYAVDGGAEPVYDLGSGATSQSVFYLDSVDSIGTPAPLEGSVTITWQHSIDDPDEFNPDLLAHVEISDPVSGAVYLTVDVQDTGFATIDYHNGEEPEPFEIDMSNQDTVQATFTIPDFKVGDLIAVDYRSGDGFALNDNPVPTTTESAGQMSGVVLIHAPQ